MHDARGKALKIGDAVVLIATITELYETEDFCNVQIRSQIGRRPDGTKETVYAINTGVLIKVGDEDNG